MSSLIAIIEEKRVSIATDTLAHQKENGKFKPLIFMSKTFCLPQHKCCFSVLGRGELATDFLLFAQNRMICKDFKTLIKLTERYLPDHLSITFSGGYSGCIFLFGYNNAKARIDAYRLDVLDGNIKVEALPAGVIVRPKIEGINSIEIINEHAQENDLTPGIFQLMDMLRQHDEALPESERIGIGGEMQVTIMEAFNDVVFKIATPYRFLGYQEHFNRMFKAAEPVNAFSFS